MVLPATAAVTADWVAVGNPGNARDPATGFGSVAYNYRIARNTFADNLTLRFQFTEALISIYPEVPDLTGQCERYHANIRIENSTFETFDVPQLFARSSRGIEFSGNRVTYHNRYPGWGKPPFILRACDGVEVSGNQTICGGRALRWSRDDVEQDLCSGVVVK